MPGDEEIFRRDCFVEKSSGNAIPLIVTFYTAIKNPAGDDYMAHANISCAFFNRDVYASGVDAAQAFFALPGSVTAYLIGRRRYGYEVYWLEKGDLDYRNFWTYDR